VQPADVRFGSLADITVGLRPVRFTPKSGTLVECIGMSAKCQKQTFGFYSASPRPPTTRDGGSQRVSAGPKS